MQTTDHHQGEHGTGHPAQQPDHGCASMTACTTAVPVMVTSGVTTVTALVIFNSPTISPSQQPPTVGAPPPFHPPKA